MYYVNIHLLYIYMYIEAIQCKLSFTVPEEGWFGQPKYSTPLKSNLRCIGSCSKYLVKWLLKHRFNIQRHFNTVEKGRGGQRVSSSLPVQQNRTNVKTKPTPSFMYFAYGWFLVLINHGEFRSFLGVNGAASLTVNLKLQFVRLLPERTVATRNH